MQRRSDIIKRKKNGEWNGWETYGRAESIRKEENEVEFVQELRASSRWR